MCNAVLSSEQILPTSKWEFKILKCQVAMAMVAGQLHKLAFALNHVHGVLVAINPGQAAQTA